MGFPVPLKEWFEGELKSFVMDNFSTMVSRKRPFINANGLLKNMGSEVQFSRKTWGLLSLELWHQQFHDKSNEWKLLS